MMPGQERPTFVRSSAGTQVDAKSKISPGKSKNPGKRISSDFPQKLKMLTTVEVSAKRGSNRQVIAKRGSRRIRERRMSVSKHNASDLRGVNI